MQQKSTEPGKEKVRVTDCEGWKKLRWISSDEPSANGKSYEFYPIKTPALYTLTLPSSNCQSTMIPIAILGLVKQLQNVQWRSGEKPPLVTTKISLKDPTEGTDALSIYISIYIYI